MKYLRLSTLIRIAVYGGLVFLAASVWAWALGFDNGAVVGAILGLTVGILMDRMMREIWKPGDLPSLDAPSFAFVYVTFMLIISLVGVAVGIFCRRRGRRNTELGKEVTRQLN